MVKSGEKNMIFDPCSQRMIDSGEEVVISGIAGRFPESDNIKKLQENLMNKVDLITDDDRRWKLDHPDIPQRFGKISNIDKFDASFFGVHFKLATAMDPSCRMLMEHTYEAVIDAGVNPRSVKNSNTGVFIGSCLSESEKTWFFDKYQANGFGMVGCSKAMLSNRLSYWLGVTGPSYTIDTACSSSLFAMEQAYRAIRNGQCEAAIVGGCNLCLLPNTTLQFQRLGVLCSDGRCKTFDERANGYVRSETVSVAYLQKAKNAKRIYATIVHGKTNCDGFKEQGITFPSGVMQTTLLRQFYEECQVQPKSIAYVEAHGTGTVAGDPVEVDAIDTIICSGRTEPLRIGSIKSNLGHAEAASGMCSIAKVIIAFESGKIPPNLNFKIPRKDIKALEKGRVRVITEPEPWDCGLTAVSSFGFGGANAHLLLRPNDKIKINGGAPHDDLPRLVVVSGRTEDAINCILSDVESRRIDVEYVRLLHDIYMQEDPGHLFRGFTILNDKDPEKRIKKIEHYPGAKRPIWFVFSGMGSQWPAMGASLLRFPVFAKAIRKCDAVLKPKNIDIYNIITNPDKSTFDNILNSFVGIAAVQIGIIDLLNSLGIVPDNIIGHSVGELGCAYADGCFTAEQMVLAAYSRGLASLETDTIRGSMAAVGLGYSGMKDLCPPDIQVACHNSPESSTISGPADSMKAFVAKLTAQKIFAREVPCSNIAYHSRYIAEAGPRLLHYLKQVIPEPKARSSKWLSTSVPRNQWSTSAARLSSAEYHTNNLLSAVLFEETSALIPKDAVTIEIAPHGLLQAILRRSLNPSVTNIALTQRGHPDNVEVFLEGIGKLYNTGHQPQIAKLYPEVSFPVSRGTPMISPLIRWDHIDDWFVTKFQVQNTISSGERIVEISLQSDDFEYMAGHVIDGRILLPATGYLALIWETVGMIKGKLYTEISVVFEDVKFLRATNLPKEGVVVLTLSVQKGSGRFEVSEGGAAVVTGYIREISNPSTEKIECINNNEKVQEMSTKDVYKELKLRGYHYSGLFRSIKSTTIDGSNGQIMWDNNLVAFMDNMLQMKILGMDSRGLFVPTGIQKLVIDATAHFSKIREMPDDNKVFQVVCDETSDTIVSGGIEIRGLNASAIARKKNAGQPVLESYKFVANQDNKVITMRDIICSATHLALDHHQGVKVKTLEFLGDQESRKIDHLISPLILEILEDIPMMQADVEIVFKGTRFEDENLPQAIKVTDLKKLSPDSNALVVTGKNLLSSQSSLLLKALEVLKKDGFVLTFESKVYDEKFLQQLLIKYNLNLILRKVVDGSIVFLLRKITKISGTSVVVEVSNDSFTWVNNLKAALKAEIEKESELSSRILIVSEKSFESGLLGLVNCLRREPGGELIRGFLLQDPNAPDFDIENPFYKEQLNLDLAINVLRPNPSNSKSAKPIWGTYRHFQIPKGELKKKHHAWANEFVRGDLSSFRWLEGPITQDCSHPDLVRIVYSAINFRDVMLATGKLAVEVVAKSRQAQECVLGFEYSGIDLNNERIMGLYDMKAMANMAIIDRSLSWKVPKSWTLEDAATVPCVYATCFYALYSKGNMKKGDKILIHAGSGGVGQAAITLALHEGCEVFTTVGTPDKLRFIKKHFPQIREDHIGNSRNTSFEQMISKLTRGKGVDIVLNSLAEEKLQASIRCLAVGGRFLEIGKFDMAKDTPVGMSAFLKEINFCGVLVDNFFGASLEKKLEFQKLLQKYLDADIIKPIVRTVFSHDQLEAAFRYMGAGKHIGKVIIKTADENNLQNIAIPAHPRFYCLPSRSYIILGGLGGFGLELADWLVLRGAKYLVLTSRTGIKNGYQKMRIKLWESYGTKVLVITGKEAYNRQDCLDILKQTANLAPVDAIFNLAVVLKDSLWENQTPETFEESFKPKAWSTKNLDELSRKICPLLRHFVVFSSVSCGRGNAGQTNYGMSNSIMERICETRVSEGLPALAIQWGAVGDVGLVADMLDDHKEIVIGGTLQQSILSCLHELDSFLDQSEPIVSSMVVAEKRAGGSGALNVVDTVLNIMGLKDIKTIGHHTSLAELGMDSMMGVEIKQTLEREFEIFLTAQDIRGLNFSKLIELDAANLEVSKKNPKPSTKSNEVLTGMRLLLRFVSDESTQNEVCLKLITKEESGRGEVIFVPGVEGSASVFSNLAGKLMSPATCLQFDSEQKENLSIPEIAKNLLPHVLARCKDRRDFLVVGYSFGSLIAIEIVRLLEAEGLTGKLILIDGSPDLMIAILKEQLAVTKESELENTILVGIMDFMKASLSGDLYSSLQNCTSWKQKLDTFIKHLPSETSMMPEEQQRNLCTSLYKRLLAILAYDPSSILPINTPITLLKPSMPTIKNMSEDFGLSKISHKKPEIYVLNGNHVTILDDSRVAAAINGEAIENIDAFETGLEKEDVLENFLANAEVK
ncbi:fatty acid synthase-like isoform X2 [Aphidius gifuensis]|uniref:fatty acid synthase-like isoform X2 n=1 Tax=Aphidius gifuensis TaxID=684658 RepID=UPI001CDBEEA9|nr:fatty acid synthase-like isoform X2 [Aphidius gifuensis]